MLYQFLHSPIDNHWLETKWILRYLKWTSSYGIAQKEHVFLHLLISLIVIGPSSPDNRMSIVGYCIYFCDSIVSWLSSSKQKVVVHFSAEVENRPLTITSAAIIWFQSCNGRQVKCKVYTIRGKWLMYLQNKTFKWN